MDGDHSSFTKALVAKLRFNRNSKMEFVAGIQSNTAERPSTSYKHNNIIIIIIIQQSTNTNHLTALKTQGRVAHPMRQRSAAALRLTESPPRFSTLPWRQPKAGVVFWGCDRSLPLCPPPCSSVPSISPTPAVQALPLETPQTILIYPIRQGETRMISSMTLATQQSGHLLQNQKLLAYSRESHLKLLHHTSTEYNRVGRRQNVQKYIFLPSPPPPFINVFFSSPNFSKCEDKSFANVSCCN